MSLNFLNLIAYFSKQPYVVEDVPLDGLGFRALWKLLRCFGNDDAFGRFWDTRSGPDSSAPLKRLRLGQFEEFDRYFPEVEVIVAGGAYSESKRGLSDFGFGQYPCSVWGSAIPTPAYVEFTASDKWLQRVEKSILIELLFDFWKVLDQYKPDFGLVDFSPGLMNLDGRTFGGITDLETPMQEWVAKSKWYQHGWKAGHVRSVYWGNYLTNAMLDRLGGRDEFLHRLIENTRVPNGKETCITWRFTNGAFIALTPDPTLTFADFDQCCFNTDIYIKELLMANLI